MWTLTRHRDATRLHRSLQRPRPCIIICQFVVMPRHTQSYTLHTQQTWDIEPMPDQCSPNINPALGQYLMFVG